MCAADEVWFVQQDNDPKQIKNRWKRRESKCFSGPDLKVGLQAAESGGGLSSEAGLTLWFGSSKMCWSSEVEAFVQF